MRQSARVVTFDCAQPAMQGLLGLGECWADVLATGEGYARARDAIRAHVEALLSGLADLRARKG